MTTPQTITLSNTMPSTALTVSSISATGDVGITSNGCGHSIGAGASCQVAVGFAPTGVGARTGTLSITDAANGSPHMIALTGTGTPTGQRAAAPRNARRSTRRRRGRSVEEGAGATGLAATALDDKRRSAWKAGPVESGPDWVSPPASYQLRLAYWLISPKSSITHASSPTISAS